jgi:hypothetical protein
MSTTFDPTAYPAPLAALLHRPQLSPLGPSTPDTSMRAALAGLRDVDLFASLVVDRPAADCCRSGLWLLHDFLDESHTISQEISTVEGSFWHAIMHRREPDAWNSKYWLRKVGNHPVLDALREQAPALGYEYADPFAFVDFTEIMRGTGSEGEAVARRVQRLEWELLFAHCYRLAVGKKS